MMKESPFCITFSDGLIAEYDFILLTTVSYYFVHKASFSTDRAVNLSIDANFSMIGHCSQNDFECLISIYVHGSYMPEKPSLEQLERLITLSEYFAMHEIVASYLSRGIALHRAYLLHLSPMMFQIIMDESYFRKHNQQKGLYNIEDICAFRDPAIYEIGNESRILANEVPVSCGRTSSAPLNERLSVCEKELLKIPYVVIAGGKALELILPQRQTKKRRLANYAPDTDLFVHAPNISEANKSLLAVIEILRLYNKQITVKSTKHAVNIHSDYNNERWQVILRLYDSVAQILHGFDISACKCALICQDGIYTAVATGSCLHSIANRTIVVDPERNSTSYVARLLKYSLLKRFSIVVPGLDRNSVSVDVFNVPIKGLTNLSALLRNEMEYKRRVEWRGYNRERTPESSIIARVLYHTKSCPTDYDTCTRYKRPGWFRRTFVHTTLELDVAPLVWKCDEPGAQTVNGSFHPLSSQNFYNC